MCIAIACQPGCDVINFEINLVFLTKLFYYMTKCKDKNLNILRTKRAFIIFKGSSVSKNCLRPESALSAVHLNTSKADVIAVKKKSLLKVC